jgi:hypothetical protein
VDAHRCGGTCARAQQRLLLQARPQGGIVAAPLEKTEILAPEAGGAIGGHERTLDAERAGAAQRIHQRCTLRGELGPLPAQQHRGGNVFLQRGFARAAAIATAVQALARQIERQRDVGAVRVRVHAHVGPFQADVGTNAVARAQLIDDAVFELERAKMTVSDRRVAAAEITRERSRRAEVCRPVNRAHTGVELRGVTRLKLRELEEYAVGNARPQAGAVGALQAAGKGHATGTLTRPGSAERGQLAHQQIGKAARRAGEQAERALGHAGGCIRLTTDRARSSSARCTFPARAGTCRARCRTA